MPVQETEIQVPQCRFLHIVPRNGGGNFLTNLTQIFAAYPEECRRDEHIFLTGDRGFYDNHAEGCKVLLFEGMDQVEMINRFGHLGAHIFVHGFFVSWRRVLKIRSSLVPKIIWRTWGADLKTPHYYQAKGLRSLYLRLTYRGFVKTVRRFEMIGVANLVDELKLEKMFGSGLHTTKFPYTDTVNSNTLYEAYVNRPKTDARIRVMVGHSGYPDDRHIPLLESLKAFQNENMVISLIMSYGNKEYIEKVRAYVTQQFGEKSPQIEWISEKMPYEDYLAYLQTMDIVLFDMVNSAALGNLAPLVYFDKKIYLNREGDMAAAFDAAGLLYGCCDEIAGQTFAAFSAPLISTDESKRKLFSFRKEYSREQWKTLLDGLS